MPKGFHALAGAVCGPFRGEPVGIEDLGVLAPRRRVPVQLRDQDQDGLARGDLVAAAERRVLVRSDGERRRGGPQPQRLLEDLVQVPQLGQVLERGALGRRAPRPPAARALARTPGWRSSS